VFLNERGTPFSTRGFQAMVERAACAAGFDMKIHPHMLRHSCGYKLANDGVDTRTIQSYLGHKSIQHTVRYTELAPTRFKSLFRDWMAGFLLPNDVLRFALPFKPWSLPFSAIDPTRIARSQIRSSWLCLGEVDPKGPKSIDKRQNELRRVLQYPAASQRAFQKLNSGYQFLVSSSFHPVWSGWYAVDYRARTAKPLPQPVSLQIGAGFAASSLALVNWIAEAGTAKITAYAFE
jgi:hypothetical protein